MLISSDSHMVEPGDLWVTRLPEHLRDRAPRGVQDPENHHVYLMGPDGSRGVDLTLSRTAGFTPPEIDAVLAEDPSAAVGVHGGHDPVARLADLWRDGTVADVAYPTGGLSVLSYDDVELQQACCRVYNDWMVEFCSVDPARLFGLALLSTADMDWAVAEIARAKSAGLAGGMIWTAPPEGETFFDPKYEALWAAAADHEFPLSLHILAGRRESTGMAAYNQDVQGSFFFGFGTRIEMQRSVAELIAAGVFERHPGLRVVAAEGGIEWAATFEQRMDRSFSSFWSKFSDNSLLPSEYFRRNVYLTYISDPVGLHNLRFTGADHFMWSSDYPHQAATWPSSAATVAEEAEEFGVDDATLRKLTLTNVADLYGIDLDVVAEPSPAIADQVAASPAG